MNWDDEQGGVKMRKGAFRLLRCGFIVFLFQVCLISPLAFSQPKQVPEKEKYGGTLVIAITKEDKSLDARYTSGRGWENSPGFQQMYEPIVDYGPPGSGEYRPLLAEKIEQVDDVTWLVRIRKGVKFHHGRELTAEDVYTQIGWALKTPQGWRAIRHRSCIDLVKGVELVDKYSLKFTLKQPSILFPTYSLMWALNGGAEPPELVEKYGKSFTNNPVGTGPFKFVEWVSGDHITIEKFNDYWGKKPYLDKVIFRVIPDPQTRLIALQKGEVDIAPIPAASLTVAEKDPNIKVYKVLCTVKPNGGAIYFNLRKWPMNSLKFRQAVAMGADWEKIAKIVTPHGLADIQRSLLNGSWAYDPKAEKFVPSYNPEKARSLIKEVEKEAGRPLPTLYFFSRDDTSQTNFLSIAGDQLKKVGVKLNLYPLAYEVANDKLRRDPKSEWDICLWRLQRGPAEGPAYIFEYYLSDKRGAPDDKNIWGYNNPKVDEMIKRGLKGGKDKKKLTALYRETERAILADLPLIPIYNEPVLYGVNKKVQDFMPHHSGWIYLVSPYNNVWIKK